MTGMLRLTDEKALQDLLARSHVRVHEPRFVQPMGAPPVGKHVPTLHKPKPPKTEKSKVVSEIEELFASQIALVKNLPAPQREYHFLRGRAHRLDFAWPDHTVNGMQIGVEIQGMVHRVRGRFKSDLEKRALGLLQNWLILEVGGEQIRNGKAMEWLQELFTKATRRES